LEPRKPYYAPEFINTSDDMITFELFDRAVFQLSEQDLLQMPASYEIRLKQPSIGEDIVEKFINPVRKSRLSFPNEHMFHSSQNVAEKMFLTNDNEYDCSANTANNKQNDYYMQDESTFESLPRESSQCLVLLSPSSSASGHANENSTDTESVKSASKSTIDCSIT
jgi:hypothetical protein